MSNDDQDAVDAGRRRLLTQLAATAGMLGLGACSDPQEEGASPQSAEIPAKALPLPKDSGIDHIIVVMMENRSFDHYFGWVPGANGRQAGLSFVDKKGVLQKSRGLAPDYQNCGHAGPDHSYEAGRTHFADGKCNGFLLTQPAGDQFPIGYYTADDLPFFKAVVQNWTLCSRYHSGLLGPTFPNRIYMHAGQTDRLANSYAQLQQPTVWDALKSVGRVGRYYYSDVAGRAFVSMVLRDHNPGPAGILPLSRFMSDAAKGTLPDVAFIDPSFLGESIGTANDDHPLADIRKGQVFLSSIYEALRKSPQWSRTLLIINYDEWGGFFDHVPPPLAPVGEAEYAATGNDGRLGFRVPCMAIGPRARRGYIEPRQLDPNSILNLITWRFGGAPLGVRASTSLNFAQVLDLESAPRLDAPAIVVPDSTAYGRSCVFQLKSAQQQYSAERYQEIDQRIGEHLDEWQGLVDLMQQQDPETLLIP